MRGSVYSLNIIRKTNTSASAAASESSTSGDRLQHAPHCVQAKRWTPLSTGRSPPGCVERDEDQDHTERAGVESRAGLVAHVGGVDRVDARPRLGRKADDDGQHERDDEHYAHAVDEWRQI